MDPMKIENFDPANDWHTYEMSWTPEYISWAIDGMEIRHVPHNDSAVSIYNIRRVAELHINLIFSGKSC